MTDPDLHAHISELVAEEKRLRSELSSGEISPGAEHARLNEIETELDRLWDLLRQRDARREFGKNPADARERSADVVEGYLQ